MLIIGRSGLASLLLLIACAAHGADAPRGSLPGHRVTALTRTIRFGVPGTPARVTLAPGSSVVVSPGNGTDTPRVLVEEGTALLDVPAAAPSLVRLMGALHGLHIRSGHAMYSRKGLLGEEVGLLLDGEAEIPTGAKSVPFPKDQLLKATTAGSVLGGLEPPLVAAAQALAAAKDVVEVPAAAVPAPGAKFANVSGPVTVVPLAGGSTSAQVSPDRPMLATDQVTDYRQRLLVGTREDGLGGAGFWLDFLPVRSGRVRNVIAAGSRGFVRFFYTPRWLVTLAPGAVLECDGPDPHGADRRPSVLKLLRGAMMVQGRGGTLPEGVTLSDLSSESSGEGPMPGSREVVTAARGPGDANVPADVLLARARETMRPLLALNLGAGFLVQAPPPAPGGAPLPRGVAPVTAITLLTDVPVAPEFITRYVPVHVASTTPLDRVSLSLFAASPLPDLSLGALVQVPGATPAAGPESVALVMPRAFTDALGPNPRPLGAYVSAQKLDLWTIRRQAEESMGRVGLQTHTGTAGGRHIDGRVLTLVVAAILLLSVPGVRLRLMAILELIPGVSTLKCRRCGMVLDRYPIGEFQLEDDHESLSEILKYDMIMEVVRQDKARVMILDRVRMKAAVPRGKPKFRFSGTWCMRCMGGSVLTEVIKDGATIDETDWDVANADTHKLLRMIKNPKLIEELTKDA